jgi:lipopolysaccharide export system permease protein
MKKIDWYLLRNFLTTFFFCIFIFAVIAVVIDTGEKTDDFVKSGLPVSQIIMQYFIGFVPHIIALLFPLFVFIAVIFFTSKLANRTEIVAILASGTSFSRFLRSYWVGGIGLATLLLVANHFIVPQANVIYTAFKSKYVDGNSSYNPLMRNNNNVYFQTSKNGFVGIHYYDTLYKSGGPFFYYELKGTEVVYNMRAESIRWDTTTRKWFLNAAFMDWKSKLAHKLNCIQRRCNLSLTTCNVMSMLRISFQPLPSTLTLTVPKHVAWKV